MAENQSENAQFSVVISVYAGDNPLFFDMALESITVKQTVVPNEIVLVVDGPLPDDLNSVDKKYEHNPIVRVIRLKENQGHGIARKTGVENSHNELIAIMDADDVSSPIRFEKQLEVFAKNNSVDVVGGIITEFIDNEKNIIGKRTVPISDFEIKEYLKIRCPMNFVTVMFKKSSIEKAGGFIDWYCEEDYYLWVRMFQAGMKFANIPDILVNVRVGNDMYKRRSGFKYFISERKLQKYMYKYQIIDFKTYFLNVAKRFILQVLMPNRIRGWVFRKFAREESC